MEVTKMNKKRLEGSPSSSPVARCPQTPTIEENSSQSSRVRGKLIVVLKTMQNIFFNPVLSMTVLGVIGGVLFPNGLPVALASVLRAFGNAFSGAALFLLGIRMVGKAKTFQGGGFILPGILIIVKLLVLPIVTRQTVNLMNAGINFTDTTDLSTFGFLYGTFPAAPGVFVIASQYNQDVDLIASSMVASTFISAPLMFMSAKMIAIHNLSPSDYMAELDKFALEISIIAIVACVYLILLFVTSKKIKRMPHRITACLVFSQLIECIGVILWSTLGQDTGWRMILQFCFFTIGGYSARLWTAMLAISLLFLQCRSLCFVLKLWPIFVVVGWGIPTILVALLLIFDPNSNVPDKRNPNFQYGNAQAAISVFILVMCFIVIIGCLILHESTTNLIGNGQSSIPHVSSVSNIPRRRRQSERNIELESSDDEIRQSNGNFIVKGCSGDGTGGGCCSSNNGPNGAVLDIEDLMTKGSINNDPDAIENDNNKLCPSQYNCAGPSRQNCKSLVEKYNDQVRDGLEPLEIDPTIDMQQTMKHIVLLILLLCSMFVGLAISVWTLVMEGMSGIYVEITFLDAFLNFGQSLMVLAVFITDSGELFLPLIKQWRKMWYGANVLKLPEWDQLSPETKHTCEQFVKHHLEHCRREIAKDRRWRIQVYKKVFYGRAFIDWLLEVGLAKDRTDAIIYGKALVDGRVLRHINNVHHFHDRNLLYTFCARF
uniref:CSON010205 protein n=1 Tax=Culicoides sonorensis TaxID=179676 RepID=A0A336MYM7_CULSO